MNDILIRHFKESYPKSATWAVMKKGIFSPSPEAMRHVLLWSTVCEDVRRITTF